MSGSKKAATRFSSLSKKLTRWVESDGLRPTPPPSNAEFSERRRVSPHTQGPIPRSDMSMSSSAFGGVGSERQCMLAPPLRHALTFTSTLPFTLPFTTHSPPPSPRTHLHLHPPFTFTFTFTLPFTFPFTLSLGFSILSRYFWMALHCFCSRVTFASSPLYWLGLGLGF